MESRLSWPSPLPTHPSRPARNRFPLIPAKSLPGAMIWTARQMCRPGRLSSPSQRDNVIAWHSAWTIAVRLGDNDFGQTDLPDGKDFVADSSGAFHNLAIRTGGSFVDWGTITLDKLRFQPGTISSPSPRGLATAWRFARMDRLSAGELMSLE